MIQYYKNNCYFYIERISVGTIWNVIVITESLLVAWKPDSKSNITSFLKWNSENHNNFFWYSDVMLSHLRMWGLFTYFTLSVILFSYWSKMILILIQYLCSTMPSNISVHQHKIQIQYFHDSHMIPSLTHSPVITLDFLSLLKWKMI